MGDEIIDHLDFALARGRRIYRNRGSRPPLPRRAGPNMATALWCGYALEMFREWDTRRKTLDKLGLNHLD